MNNDEFSEFFEENFELLVFFLMKWGILNDAEDIAVEAFLKVKKQGIRSSAKGLLNTTAMNLYRDVLRKKKNLVNRAVTLNNDIDRADTKILEPHKIIEKQDLMIRLHCYITNLPEKHQSLFISYYYENKPIYQICQELGISRYYFHEYLAKILGDEDLVSILSEFHEHEL